MIKMAKVLCPNCKQEFPDTIKERRRNENFIEYMKEMYGMR